MTSCGSEHCSYNALPVAVTCFNGSQELEDGATDRKTSTTRSSPLQEMGAAPLAPRPTSTTSVDPAVATPAVSSTAFQARKKRSFAGGYSMGGVTEALNGKHVMGGSGKAQGCPRDRLQRHRLQVAGAVRIPEAWCGEARLREWVSSCDVEEALHPPGLFMARAALISAGSSLSAATSPALLAPPAAPPASWEVPLLS